MIEAVVAGLEVSVLDVTHEVLGEQGVAVPEMIGNVDAAAQAPLLRTRESVHRAADDSAIGLESEHQVRG